MSRKTVYRVMAFILVLVAALGVTGAAFAAPVQDPEDPQDPEAHVRLAGTILSLSDPDFVLRTRDGHEVTVHTTGATQWHHLGGFGSLQVGMRVGVKGVLQGNGTINAKHVALPPRFRLAGVVTAVGDHSLTVDTRAGRTVTVLWDAGTRCAIFGRGDSTESNSACSRIVVGDHLAAGGARDGDTLMADWIVVRVPRPAPAVGDGVRE